MIELCCNQLSRPSLTNLLAKAHGMAENSFVVFNEIGKESFSKLKTNFLQSLNLEPIKRRIYENR